MSSSDIPKISVVVPVHNGGEAFRQCLENLTTASPPPFEVIVVADGETDGSGDLAESYGAHVLRLPVAGGPARARNLGAQHAQGDIVFFVDADVALAKDAIGQVITTFEANPNLAAIFGSYDDQPAEPNFLSQYKNLMHHYVHQTGQEDASTFWSGCGAIQKDIFLAMGGFSIDYERPCIEDIELGYRLKQAGHQIRLCKTLQGKHLKYWGPISLVKTDFFQRALPWTELILRDNQMANDLNLDSNSRASVVLTYCLLGALVGGIWWSGFWVVAAAISLVLMFLNASVYRFFREKRGVLFSLQVIPWHWLYYFYGGLAFGIGLLRHLVQQRNTTASISQRKSFNSFKRQVSREILKQLGNKPLE